MQAFVVAAAVVDVALVVYGECLYQEWQWCLDGLFGIALSHSGTCLDELCRGGVFADEQVAQVGAEAVDEVLWLKTALNYVVQ